MNFKLILEGESWPLGDSRGPLHFPTQQPKTKLCDDTTEKPSGLTVLQISEI